jgi:hypothetical protein
MISKTPGESAFPADVYLSWTSPLLSAYVIHLFGCIAVVRYSSCPLALTRAETVT